MKGAVRVAKDFDMHGSLPHILTVGFNARARGRGINQDIVSHGVMRSTFGTGGDRVGATRQKQCSTEGGQYNN